MHVKTYAFILCCFMQTGGRMLSIWAACGRSCTFLQPSRARTALRSARRLTRTVTRTLTRAIVTMSWSWAPLPRSIALCTCGKRAFDAWEDACFWALYVLMLMSGVKEVLIPPSGVPNKGSVFIPHRPLMSMVDQHSQSYSSQSLRPGPCTGRWAQSARYTALEFSFAPDWCPDDY